MSLLDHINRNNHLADASARIAVHDLLRGETWQARDMAFRSQRYRCEAREYSETLRISSEVQR